jgi:nicotinamidase-related amidase
MAAPLEWNRSALLLTDAQHAYLDPGLEQACAQLAAIFRRAGRPIVHVVRLQSPADPSPIAAPTPGSTGGLIPPSILDHDDQRRFHPTVITGGIVQVGAGEFMVWRPRWSALLRTRLDGHLAALGVTTVVVAGGDYRVGPRATLSDATAYDYRALAIADACGGFTSADAEDAAAIGAHVAAVEMVERALARPREDSRAGRDTGPSA